MKKEKLKKHLSNIDTEVLANLKGILDEEMSKPAGKRNEKLIADLENLISKINEKAIGTEKMDFSELVMKKPDDYKKPKRSKICKRLSVTVVCLLAVLGVNMASLKVYGQNMFSAAYQFTKGGIMISPDQAENKIDIEVSESDPYGMKAKCAEYGFFPETPSYIPDGFVLYQTGGESNDYLDYVFFFYRKKKVILNFYFTNYKTNNKLPPIGIPTDTYNITEEQINGHTTYILKEDDQFTANFYDGQINFGMFAIDLDYDECEKVLGSLS